MTGSDRRAALAVLCTGMLMIILDGTIVAVALPSIQTALGFSASEKVARGERDGRSVAPAAECGRVEACPV